MFYEHLIKTGSVLLLLPFSTVLGFTPDENTGNGRAAPNQLYSFAIEVWYATKVQNNKNVNMSDFTRPRSASLFEL